MKVCESCGGRNKHGDWCEFYGSDQGLDLYDNDTQVDEDAFIEPEPEDDDANLSR